MRRQGAAEKGSALLIVFAFAAIVAITLYMEMPVTVFEAKRQKEQITIDHGKEYAHAVKLFVRKIGRYPSSLDELDNTNNMRFLRHKFKDPFTNDNDWRLLHAGPGGVLLDSKVKPATSSTFLGNTNSAGFGSAGGTSNSGTSNSTNSGSSATNSSSAATGNNTSSGSSEPDFPMAGSIAAEANAAVQPAAPKRPPAVAANGSAAVGGNAANSDQSSWESLVPPLPGEQSGAAGQPNTANGTATAAAAAPASTQTANATNGQAGNSITDQGQNTAAKMQNMLNQMSGSGGQTNTGTGGATFGTSNGTSGTLASGGIAGVAVPMKVAGAGIKAVNDQHKYQLWEFYYDPTQDTLKAMPTAQNVQGANVQNRTGTSAFGSNNGSAFASSGATGTSASSQSSDSNTDQSGNTSQSGTSATGTGSSNPPQQP